MVLQKTYNKYSKYIEQSDDLNLKAKLNYFKASYEKAQKTNNYFDYEFRAILHEIKTHEFLSMIGNNISTSDDTNHEEGPDFLHKGAWFECVIATLGDLGSRFYKKSISIHQNKYNKVHSTTLPQTDVMLRVTTAIGNKKKQYKKHLEDGVIKSNDKYVMVIDITLLFEIYPLIHRIDFKDMLLPLLGIGPITLFLDKENLEYVGQDYERYDSIKKLNKTDIDVNIFQRPEYSFISAILFTRTINTIDSYSIQNSIFMLNPLANVTLNEEDYTGCNAWKEIDGKYKFMNLIKN